MGIAAVRRGDAVITRQLGLDPTSLARAAKRADQRRALELEEEAHVWRRAAMDFFVDAQDPHRGGFVRASIKAVVRRDDPVFRARLRKVTEAHVAWLHVDQSRAPFESLTCAQAWARAVFSLLRWCCGDWRCEVLDRAPRHCRP